jgi:hypothetical protein
MKKDNVKSNCKMTAINSNIEVLKQNLLIIKAKGKSYGITITTIGNLLYILNEGTGFYVLLVPNKKLTPHLSMKILQINGWKEKFHLTNYHKNFYDQSIEMIAIEIENILNNLLLVPISRTWRFELSSGMMALKANEVLLDAYSRREINKAKVKSPLRRLSKLLFYPFSTNLRMSIVVTIVFGAGILYKELSINASIDYQSIILISGIGLLSYFIFQLNYPEKN